MKTVLIKNGIVQNVAVTGTASWRNAIKDLYDSVIDVPDPTFVGPGFSYDGTSFSPTAASIYFDPELIIKQLYQTLSDKLTDLAPWFGVFEKLVQYKDWSGLNDFLNNLVKEGVLVKDEYDKIISILKNNTVDLAGAIK